MYLIVILYIGKINMYRFIRPTTVLKRRLIMKVLPDFFTHIYKLNMTLSIALTVYETKENVI